MFNIFRIFALVVCMVLISGGTYMSYKGVWGESSNLDKSVRLGSPGNHYSGSRVK